MPSEAVGDLFLNTIDIESLGIVPFSNPYEYSMVSIVIFSFPSSSVIKPSAAFPFRWVHHCSIRPDNSTSLYLHTIQTNCIPIPPHSVPKAAGIDFILI